MKVVQIHNQKQIKGGAEIYLHQLHVLLHQNHNKSEIIYIEGENSSIQLSLDDNIKILNEQQAIEYLQNFLDKIKADFIFLHNNFNLKIEKFLAKNYTVIKFAHSPVLVCPGKDKYWRNSNKPCNISMGLHCFYHIYSEQCANRHPRRVFQSYNYVQQAIELAKSSYKGVVVMSQWHKDLLLELDVPDEKILLNPYFTEYVEQKKIKTQNEKRLFFAGRLTPGKGLEELIEVSAPLLKKYPDLYLDIIGEGILMDKIEKEVIKLGIQKKITFHGWKDRSEIRKILENAYLLIFPSTYPETFGIVGIEAQMYSLPAVAFDVGGISTWLKHEKNGFISQLGDINSMKSNIELLINYDEIYQNLSSYAYESVNRDFIEVIHLNKLINFLKK